MAAEAPVDLQSATAVGATERLLVEFELGGECYGVDIADIREIIRYQPITVLPGAPDIVEGIINLRGRVTPIVNLHQRLGMESAEVNDATRIIVIEVDDALVGVHVDAVTGVVTLTNEQVQQLSADMASDRSDHLEGVANIDGRLIVLINLQLALAGTGMSAANDDTVAPADSAESAADATPSDAPAEPAPVLAPVDSPANAERPTDEVVAGPEDSAETAEEVAVQATPAAITVGGVDLGLAVDLLEQSFEAIQAQADQLDTRFYANLFAQHPTLEPLFAQTDIHEQSGTLLSLLASVIASVRRSDVLLPQLEELGRSLLPYGAEPAHYELVGTVLIETLGAVAGELWTDEVRDAWSDAVTLAAVVMMDAPAQAEVPAVAAATEAVAPAVEAVVQVPTAEPVAAAVPRPKTPAAKKPAAKPTAKQATAGKPAAKQAAARKPAAQKPAAKSVAKKPAAKPRAGAKA